MKYKELKKQLESKGWKHIRTSGSHRIFTHPDALRPISIAVHGKEDIDPKTTAKILKNAERLIKKA